METSLTRAQIEDYARELILSHATDIEFLSVIEFECYDDKRAVGLSKTDALRVFDMIQRARVTVTFPESP